jgi:integrase
MPLKLVRRHGSDNWYMRGAVRGVTVDESTGVPDKALAQRVLEARETEIILATLPGRRASAPFLAVAVSYMENGGEPRFVHALVDYFGTRPVSEIGQADLELAAKAIYPGCARSTINRQVFTPFSAIMRHGAVRGMCENKELERPPQPKGRVRWLTLEEADRLIASCSTTLQPVVVFLLYTGARLSEALMLDWRQVDLKRAHVAFLDTKNGTDRGMPLHPRVVAALANLSHRDGRVFLTSDGKAYGEGSVDGRGYIGSPFRAACKRAGITDFHPHDCRHTWATWHYAANRDLLKLMTLGGWKTISMVQRYAHVNTEHLADSIMALGGEGGDHQGTRDAAKR